MLMACEDDSNLWNTHEGEQVGTWHKGTMNNTEGRLFEILHKTTQSYSEEILVYDDFDTPYIQSGTPLHEWELSMNKSSHSTVF